MAPPSLHDQYRGLCASSYKSLMLAAFTLALVVQAGPPLFRVGSGASAPIHGQRPIRLPAKMNTSVKHDVVVADYGDLNDTDKPVNLFNTSRWTLSPHLAVERLTLPPTATNQLRGREMSSEALASHHSARLLSQASSDERTLSVNARDFLLTMINKVKGNNSSKMSLFLYLPYLFCHYLD